MDRESAKNILSDYRPGETDHLDKKTLDALAMARTDPVLAAWFGQHCASVAQNSGRRRLPSTSLDLEKPKPEAVPQVASRQKKIVIMGTSVLALLAVGLIWYWLTLPVPENTLENFRSYMANLAQHSFPMKTSATSLDEIKNYFRTNSGTAVLELPRNLEKLPGHGAAVFAWHNQPVSLVGFEAGAKTNLYLFLADSSEMINPPANGSTQWLRVGQMLTACWVSNGKVYFLAGPDDEALMKAVVE